MKLWIGNLNPETTDEELRELIGKYTKLEISTLTRVPGDGSLPAALLELERADDAALSETQRRLHGIYWKDRALNVEVVLFTDRP